MGTQLLDSMKACKNGICVSLDENRRENLGRTHLGLLVGKSESVIVIVGGDAAENGLES